MVVPLPLISSVVLLLNDVSSSSINITSSSGCSKEKLPSFNSNTTGDINGRRTTYLEHPLLLVILMEEELPSFNSNTAGDINGRGTYIAVLLLNDGSSSSINITSSSGCSK
jgi:hypothetical protein